MVYDSKDSETLYDTYVELLDLLPIVNCLVRLLHFTSLSYTLNFTHKLQMTKSQHFTTFD